MTSRRDFLGVLGATALLPTLAPSPAHSVGRTTSEPIGSAADWDMSWVERITGSHRAVFDAPELSNGVPVLRAAMWPAQCREVYGATDNLTSTVLVVRHHAIVYAMDDATWDRFDLAKANDLSLFAGAVPAGNPMLRARADVPAPLRNFTLEAFQASGGIVLGCNMAFDIVVVPLFAKASGATPAAAREEALSHLLPGVILMPSGFFAAAAAQEAGCQFIPAS